MPETWNVPLQYERSVVTGGGSGIGRAIALTLADVGSTVYVMGRRQDPLEETVALAAGLAGRVVAVPCDTRHSDIVDRAFRAVEADGGPAQALAHCAANVDHQPAITMSEESFRTVVESTLFGGFNVLRRWAEPLLRDGLGGAAVSLSSAAAVPGRAGHRGLLGGEGRLGVADEDRRGEWGPAGLRVNVVGPGATVVPRAGEFLGDQKTSGMRSMVALGGRPAVPQEIADPVVFLLSEAARYITGVVLHVDGGFRLTPSVIPSWTFYTAGGEALSHE